ncbi:MAG: hypothetical protein JWM86_265 [Thermoleophilia bacterium]|nr:hypothetical protein [Thermoleophilia bacterium]
MRPRRTSLIRAALVACALLVALPAGAGATTLYGTVGPGYDISLKTAAGRKVTSVRAGVAYTIVVRDRSSAHNFRLAGPGVLRTTTVPEVVTRTWKVTFRVGKYGYICSPHSLAMMGTFIARA